jgi:hemoglobin
VVTRRRAVANVRTLWLAALLRSHLGLSITDEQRARWMELMAAAVDKELPNDELLRRRVMEYFDRPRRRGPGRAGADAALGLDRVDVSEPPPATDSAPQ